MCRLFHDIVFASKTLHAMTHVEPVDIGLSLRCAVIQLRGTSLRLQHYKPRSVLISYTFRSRVPVQWGHVYLIRYLNVLPFHLLKKHLCHICQAYSNLSYNICFMPYYVLITLF